MYWTNYGWWESVGVNKNRNFADEIISRQEHHVALLNGQEGCYSGGYKYTNGSGDLYNIEDTSSFHTGKYTAYNDTWTQTSGNTWWDDGGKWAFTGELDICKTF